MKKYNNPLITAITLIVLSVGMLVFLLTGCKSDSNKLVILHSNDTHSHIVNEGDLGGALRRKAAIDSIRAVEPNVLVIDAGDAVQGSLFFYLYGGVVEQEIFNILGVDMRILGNHEFDNGVDSLAYTWALSNAEKISTNYNLSGTPLASQFQPYSIRKFGDKKIGFIGINLDPEGMIAKGNYDGVEFLPIVASANLAAEKLRNEDGVDAVIAITHIGYNPAGLIGDSILAVNSRGIDVIIGGHSHDKIDPATAQGARRSQLTNLEGKTVLVTQTGKYGGYLGKIEIDLDQLGTAVPNYELLPLDKRYDSKPDADLADLINRYSAGVDSLMHHKVSEAQSDMAESSPELLNFFVDFLLEQGNKMAPNVDLALANKGGLRIAIPKGDVSKGQILNLLPFRNKIVVLDIEGKHLRDVLGVMARTGGNGITKSVYAEIDTTGNVNRLGAVKINGKPLDDNKTYRVVTIDYLAKGGDYMDGLTEGKWLVESEDVVFNDMLYYLTDGAGKDKPVGGDPQYRWTLVGSTKE